MGAAALLINPSPAYDAKSNRLYGPLLCRRSTYGGSLNVTRTVQRRVLLAVRFTKLFPRESAEIMPCAVSASEKKERKLQ